MKNMKKYIVTVLALAMFALVASFGVAFAQTATPSPTPTSTPTSTIDDDDDDTTIIVDDDEVPDAAPRTGFGTL